MVACGPPGLAGGKNILYHNNGDGTFTDVSQKAGMWTAVGNYALERGRGGPGQRRLAGHLCSERFDGGNSLYQNQKDGTFKDVAIEVGRGAFAGWQTAGGHGRLGRATTTATARWISRRRTSPATRTRFTATWVMAALKIAPTRPGLGMNTRYLGWGVGFFDMDNDGWLDLLVSNGHVYPEVSSSKTEAPYAEHKYLYRNLRNGRFEDVSDKGRPRNQSPQRRRAAVPLATTTTTAMWTLS